MACLLLTSLEVRAIKSPLWPSRLIRQSLQLRRQIISFSSIALERNGETFRAPGRETDFRLPPPPLQGRKEDHMQQSGPPECSDLPSVAWSAAVLHLWSGGWEGKHILGYH